MKAKYLFTSLVAVCALAIGCTKTYPTQLDEIQLSQSTVGLTASKASSVDVTVTATDAWTIETEIPSWLKVSPTSGTAGTTKVTISSTGATAACNKVTLTISCAGKTQYLIIQQGVPEVKEVTCKEVLEGSDGATYKVTGLVSSIAESATYGNWYITDDTGTVYIYGTKNSDGETKKGAVKSYGLEVGDQVTVEGPRTTYNGTIELVDVTVIKIVKSLVKICNESVLLDAPKEGKVVDLNVIAKGGDLKIKSYDDFGDEVDWVSVRNIDVKKAAKSADPDTTVIKIVIAPNVDDVREASLEVTSGSSTVAVPVTQKSGLAAYKLPFTQTFDTSFGPFEVVDVYNPDEITVFSIDTKYQVAKASAYISGTNHESVVALTSPMIDLDQATTASLTFEHAYRYGSNKYEEMTLEVSKDNGTTWNPILIPDYGPADKSFTMTSNTVSLTPFVGNLIMFRFRYSSHTTGCSTWEIKNVSVTADEAVVKNIAQLNSLASAAAEREFTANLDNATVSYVSGNNAFLQDATGGIQLYMKNHGLNAGDVLKGEISGKIKLYAGYAELTSIDVTKAEKTTGEVVVPELDFATLQLSYLRYQNCLCKISGDVTLNVTLDSKTRDGIFTQGEISFAARLQDKNQTINAGTGALTCIPSRYNENLQIGIWEAGHFTPAN